MNFEINGISWKIVFVNPNSELLSRSDNTQTVGVTDQNTYCIYLSDILQGAFLRKVVCHELVHAFMMSYDLNIPIEQEEYMADFIATYGEDLIYLLDDLMKKILRRVA